MSTRYFVKLYGSQHRLVNRPFLSHTFAAFKEQQLLADGTEQKREITISWLPRDGRINPLGPAEPGQNYSLSETFAWLDEARSTIRWESTETEITSGLFDAAEERVRELESNVLRYKMVDRLATRPHQVSNCIHAVSDLTASLDQLGMAFTGALHGIEASRFVFHYFQPFYIAGMTASLQGEQLFDTLHHATLTAQMTATASMDLTPDAGPEDRLPPQMV